MKDIISRISKKNEKQSNETSYFQNTHQIFTPSWVNYKNPSLTKGSVALKNDSDNSDDDDSDDKPLVKGIELLKKIYGGKKDTETSDELFKTSNPILAQKIVKKIYGNDTKLLPSDRIGKKYKILNKDNNKFIHFGDIKMEDYLKHQDEERRERYLKRAIGIKGNWRDDMYSPNLLSILITWDGLNIIPTLEKK